MSLKIDPQTGEFQVDPATGEFIDDGIPPPKLGDMGKSDLAFLSPGADASTVALDRSGTPVRSNNLRGADIVKSLLPRTSAVDAGGPGARPAAYAMDLLSAPGRALASLPQSIGGGADGVLQGMQDTHGDRFAGKMLRSPATAAMTIAAPFTGGLSLLPASAIAGTAGAAANQVDNAAQGKEVSIPKMATDAAAYTAGGYVLGKAMPIVADAIKGGLSRMGGAIPDAIAPAFERAGVKSILTKLGYDPKLVPNSEPAVLGEGVVANTPMAIAQRMKSVDLLHQPEQAKLNLEAGKEKFGKLIGAVVQKATDADVRVPIVDAVNDFANATAQALKEHGVGSTTYNSLMANVMPNIKSAVSNLNPDAAGTVPFEKAVEFKRSLQDLVRSWGQEKDLSTLADAAKSIQGRVGDVIDASHPVYGPLLTKLNKPYSALMDFEPMINKAFDAAQKTATQTAAAPGGGPGPYLPHSQRGVILEGLKRIVSPRETITDMLPGFADRAANSGSAKPFDISTPSAPIDPADLAAINQPWQPSGGLQPRAASGRPALDKPPAYAPGPAVPRAFGPATPTQTPTADPMADLYPTNRNPALEPPQGVPGIEGMMSPEDAQPSDIRASWEAAIRQARPVRVPPVPEAPGGVQVINTQDLPLGPRTPKGDIQPNGFPPLQESPAIQDVLNKYEANRRPLVVNQSKIDALKELLKQDLPKAKKREILKLIRDENLKIALPSLGE